MVMGTGMTTIATAKNIMMMPRLRSEALKSVRAVSRSSSATARETFGKIAVAIETATREYGKMYSVKAY